MGGQIKNPGGLLGLLALAAVVGPAHSASAASETANQPITVKAPDVSHYDCTAITGTGAKRNLHIGQWVLGRYYEWNEIYSTDGDPPRLLCVSMTVPQPQQLTATQASTFLTQSAAIGVPAPGAPPGTSEKNASENDSAAGLEPANVKPEPLKRRRSGAPPPPAGEQLPPVPAEHHVGDPAASSAGPAPVAPSSTPLVEKQSSLVPERAAATDPRTAVGSSTTETYPYNTVGYLSVTYPDGNSFRCTGTVVSPYVVLTAGHCIQNNDHGGWVSQVRFYPGQISVNGGAQHPYGVNASATNLKATQTWTQISGPDEFDVDQYQYDYAAIQFTTPFTYTTTFMPVIYSSTASTATNSGYPANLENSSVEQEGQYSMSGSETGESISQLRAANVREFAIYSSGGDSGSAFWQVDSTGRRSVIGSLSYGSDDTVATGGPWYNSWNQSLLSSWIAWTPSSGAVVALPSTGLQVGGVFSSLETAQSFLRFYNTGATASAVTVMLSDYLTGTPLASWTSPSIPSGASPQYAISTIEAGAAANFTKPAYYSVNIQTSMTGYFQHVLWHVADGSLTNLSTCAGGPTYLGSAAMNVHSSLLAADYPSTLFLFNTGTSDANVKLLVYDAATGGQIGTYSAAVPANGQSVLPMTAIESSAGISAGTRYHYIVKVSGTFTGYLQHLVDNLQTGVTTDMTAVCALVN